MSYLVQKQYSLRNQPFYKLYGMTVALVDPDSESRAIYGKSFRDINMEVEQYESLGQLMDQIAERNFHIIIVSPMQKDIPQLAQLKSFAPSTPLITMSKMMAESQLDGIMKLGVSLHINREFSQPRDLLVAVEQVLLTNY